MIIEFDDLILTFYVCVRVFLFLHFVFLPYRNRFNVNDHGQQRKKKIIIELSSKKVIKNRTKTSNIELTWLFVMSIISNTVVIKRIRNHKFKKKFVAQTNFVMYYYIIYIVLINQHASYDGTLARNIFSVVTSAW